VYVSRQKRLADSSGKGKRYGRDEYPVLHLFDKSLQLKRDCCLSFAYMSHLKLVAAVKRE